MENAGRIINEVKKVIYGKDEVIRKVLLAILANGNILIEDIPGVGKTTLAMAFSRTMDLLVNRMQFTPDVMPADVTGYTIFNRETKKQEYRAGAIMCNLFMADEINRTSSKTQSALLEVMEEGKVTVDGITREVLKPFFVIATQNPIGSAGTQHLPDSQLDRFLIQLSIGYPSLEHEVEMLRGKEKVAVEEVQHVINKKELLEMQKQVNKVFLHDVVLEYIGRLAAATREHQHIAVGLSPRASIALVKMAKAEAYVNGRDYAIPDDVIESFREVAIHRLILNSEAKVSGANVEKIIQDLKRKIAKPRVK